MAIRNEAATPVNGSRYNIHQLWAKDKPDVTPLDVDGASMKKHYFAPREVIYHEGEPADKIFEITAGLIKLQSYLPNGKTRIVRLHGPGEWIGQASLLQKPYDHTAVAVDSVEVRCISVNEMQRWKQENPHKYYRHIENLYSHLQKADLWIAQFSTGCIRARVARLVNYLSEVEYGDSSLLVKLLTCEEMAAILGATPESVSSILAEFKRKGVLRLVKDQPQQKVYERNAEALAHHAHC